MSPKLGFLDNPNPKNSKNLRQQNSSKEKNSKWLNGAKCPNVDLKNYSETLPARKGKTTINPCKCVAVIGSSGLLPPNKRMEKPGGKAN